MPNRNKHEGFLKIADLKFWVPIIILFVGWAVTFTKLEGKVKANYIEIDERFNSLVGREQLNKEQFKKVAETVEIMYKNQLKIGFRLEIDDMLEIDNIE